MWVEALMSEEPELPAEQAPPDRPDHTDEIREIYRQHAPLFDLTRWLILFGKRALLKRIRRAERPARILEIGSGTGKLTRKVAKLCPDARIVGIDLSEDMLRIARRRCADLSRVAFTCAPFVPDCLIDEEPFDLVLCSYSLSMMGDSLAENISYASRLLRPGGRLIAIDFQTTPSSELQWNFARYRVSIDGSVLNVLEKTFKAEHVFVRRAYLGFWKFFVFEGTCL
jgi:S-adenosylmethionine-diacylgycerolhomoserine-N-methlytransferase